MALAALVAAERLAWPRWPQHGQPYLDEHEACKCRDVSPTIYHRKEASLTTVGLLTLLSFWATVMRAISARNTALKLMASFLGVFIDWVKEEIEESFGIIYGSEVLLYQEDVDTPQRCMLPLQGGCLQVWAVFLAVAWCHRVVPRAPCE